MHEIPIGNGSCSILTVYQRDEGIEKKLVVRDCSPTPTPALMGEGGKPKNKKREDEEHECVDIFKNLDGLMKTGYRIAHLPIPDFKYLQYETCHCDHKDLCNGAAVAASSCFIMGAKIILVLLLVMILN